MMISNSLFKKLTTCLMAGFTFAALLLVVGNGGNIPWFPPIVVFSLAGISLLTSLVFPIVWQFKENRQTINSVKVFVFLYAFIRYTIAFNLASFGWKKVFGLQFIVPAEISEKPMNQLSGEWLTWYYFGYSVAFGVIIAIVQIGGSFLLLFRKTLLLGAITLFPFMLNLMLINIFYRMNAGALLQSVILTAGIFFLLMLDYNRLVACFIKAKSNLPSLALQNNFLKNMLWVATIVLSLLFTLYLKSMVK